jgi:hypothetical protein
MAQQIGRRDLRSRICRTMVTRKTAHSPEALGPVRRVNTTGAHGPLQGRLGCDERDLTFFHEGDKLAEIPMRMSQLEAQLATQSDIVFNGRSQGAHRAPPGHGMARSRNAVRSTFA